MKFLETTLKGAYIVEIEPVADNRGFFARSWCEKEFEAAGLGFKIEQCNISFNEKKNTLRGMHWQASPHGEAKLVRCTMGAIYDVIVDMRPDSPTYKKWFATELTAQNRRMLFIPEYIAHGFQTLEDNSEVFYHMSSSYYPESACGFRWDDPAFGIKWPDADERVISLKDAEYPLKELKI